MMSYGIFTRVSYGTTKNLFPYIIRGISSTSKSRQAQALDTIHDDKQRIKVFMNYRFFYSIGNFVIGIAFNSSLDYLN